MTRISRAAVLGLGGALTCATAVIGLQRALRWHCGSDGAGRSGDADRREAPVAAPRQVAPPPTPSPISPTEPTDVLIGVAASPTADVTVVWSRHNIRALPSGSALLDGSEEVKAVTVGPDGTVYAIRGEDWLGTARPHRAAEWRRAPVAGETLRLQVVDGWLAWLTEQASGPHLVLTRDRGRSWIVQELPALDRFGPLRLLPGGGLELLGYVNDCHIGDYFVLYGGHLRSNRWRELPWRDEGLPTFGQYGRVYISPAVFGRDRAYALSHDSSTPRLIGLVSGRKVVLDETGPQGLELMTVDHQGRPSGLSRGRLWRWSPRNHWQPLDLPEL